MAGRRSKHERREIVRQGETDTKTGKGGGGERDKDGGS